MHNDTRPRPDHRTGSSVLAAVIAAASLCVAAPVAASSGSQRGSAWRAAAGSRHARPRPQPAITIRVGSMTVNGLKVKNLRCTLASGGFLAAAKVVGALAKKRGALEACARKKKARPHVSWRFSAKRVTHVRVRGARAKVNACVKGVMRRVRMGLRGSCSATLLLP